MGTAAPKPERNYVETGHEPEYFVTHTRIEQAGHGNLRMFCYAERQSVFMLLYTVIIPVPNLLEMARRDLIAATEAQNLTIWHMDDDVTH